MAMALAGDWPSTERPLKGSGKEESDMEQADSGGRGRVITISAGHQ
jgi:hypothetical protein